MVEGCDGVAVLFVMLEPLVLAPENISWQNLSDLCFFFGLCDARRQGCVCSSAPTKRFGVRPFLRLVRSRYQPNLSLENGGMTDQGMISSALVGVICRVANLRGG